VWNYLEDCGVKVDHNESDEFQRSLLFYSVYRCDYNDRTILLERLLPLGIDLTQQDYEDVTPLMAACRANNFKAVIRLINAMPGDSEAYYTKDGGFNVNDHIDTTWQHDPRWRGCGGMEIINGADRAKNTPLLYAVLHQNSYMVLALLAAGARVDYLNTSSGMTPLILAVRGSQYGSFALCSILVKAGADVMQVDTELRTALDFAFIHARYKASCCVDLGDLRVLAHA